jgi:hypothetical protein
MTPMRSPDRSGAPRTDTWTPHGEQPGDVPVVYDRHGQLGTGPSRRPGVSRAALGLETQPGAPDPPYDAEMDPTGPLPTVTPDP